MLAMPIALFLQAVLGHGGFQAIGINSCVMGLPAVLAWWLFVLLQRLPWVRSPWFCSGLVGLAAAIWLLSLVYSLTLLLTNTGTAATAMDYGWANELTFHPLTVVVILAITAVVVWAERRLENVPEFSLGLLVGEAAVLATVFLHYLVWVWGAGEDWQKVGLAVFVAHLPIAVVEGIVLGFTVGFLVKVKPEIIGWKLLPDGRLDQVPSADTASRETPSAVTPAENLECHAHPRP
jgi:ABC-type Co2+ transport system permease subunit